MFDRFPNRSLLWAILLCDTSNFILFLQLHIATTQTIVAQFIFPLIFNGHSSVAVIEESLGFIKMLR